MPERTVITRRKAQQQGDEVNDGDKVWVTIARNVNLGDYETYRMEAGFSQTIKQGGKPMEMIEDIEDQVSIFVIEKTNEVKNELTDKIVTTTRRRRK